jgi:hypothetical protein
LESIDGILDGRITFKVQDSDFIHTMTQIHRDCGQILNTVKEHYYPDISTALVHPIRDDVITLNVNLKYDQTVFTDEVLRPIHIALLKDVRLRCVPTIHVRGLHITPIETVLDLEVFTAEVTDIRSNIEPIIVSEGRPPNEIPEDDYETCLESDLDDDYYDYKACVDSDQDLNEWYWDDDCDDAYYKWKYDHPSDDESSEYDLRVPWKMNDVIEDAFGDMVETPKAESELRNYFSDRNFISRVVRSLYNKWYKYIDLELKYDSEISKQALYADKSLVVYAPLKIRLDPYILGTLHDSSLIPKSVWTNKDLLQGLLLKDSDYFNCIHDDLKGDLDLILSAVAARKEYYHPMDSIYKNIAPSLMWDLTKVALIIEADYYNMYSKADNVLYKYIDPSFLSDKESALFLLRKSPHSRIFRYLSPKLKRDRDIVTVAVQTDGLNLEYLDPIFKSNREFTMLAVQQNGMALRYVDPTFKDDVEIIVMATDNNPKAMQFVSDQVQRQIHGRRTKRASRS